MATLAAEEIRVSPAARKQYLDLWRRSGVTVACGTFSGAHRMSGAFDRASETIARGYLFVDALGGGLQIARRAADIERIQREGAHGIVIDFQNTTPFGDDLSRVE